MLPFLTKSSVILLQIKGQVMGKLVPSKGNDERAPPNDQDLAHISGAWRWETFFSDSEISLAELLQLDAQCASSHDVMPTVLVLLEEEVPAGTVALC